MKISFFKEYENYLKDLEIDVDSELQAKLDNILHLIRIDIGLAKRRKKIRFIRSFTAVAVACMLIGIGIQVFFSPYVELKKATLSETRIIVAKNNTSSVKLLTLKDSTVLELWPAAYLQYTTEYNRSERNITHVSGKVNYKVAKGRLPFVVKTGLVQTIAVGTEFIINKQDSTSVTIELLEGRVKVKKANLKDGSEEFLLVQGETLNIKHNQVKKLKPGPSTPLKSVPDVNLERLHHDLDFKSESLWAVLQRLEKEYDLQIDVDRVLVDSLSFTGSFKSGMKVEDVIGNICLLNDLIYSRNRKVYTINKNN